jgi:hypothetical protein
VSGFVKRFLLSMVASKLQRKAHRGNPIAGRLLGEVNRRLYGHRGHQGHGGYGHQPYGPPPGYHHGGYHGHYRHRGHYRHKGHYRRTFW